MADTATFGAAMAKNTIGAIRETCHAGRVLLYGSGGDQGTDGNPHTANPTGFKGIQANAEVVNATEGVAKVRLHMGYNPSGGYRHENDTLVEPGSDKYTTLIEPTRAYYASFSLTGQLMAAAAKGEREFKPAFQENMERTVTSAKTQVNIAAFGTGNGVVATIRANEAAGQTIIDVDTTIYFRGGEIIDGLTISTGVVIEPAREVISVDRANLRITVSPALTTGLTATTDGWVMASSNSTVAAPNNSWNRGIMGLQGHIDSSGTTSGINPALYPQWASYEAGSVGAISESAMRLAKNTVGFETGLNEGDGMDFVWITTRGVRDRFADTQMPLKRHVNTQKLDAGFDVIMMDSEPIFCDDHCPIGQMYGLRVSKFMWATLKDWSWMDEDGAVLSRVPGKDRYQAILYTYHALLQTHRGAHAKLTGITDDTR